MDPNKVTQQLSCALDASGLPPPAREIMKNFLNGYLTAVRKSNMPVEESAARLLQFFNFINENIAHPHIFSSFHQAIRSPFDYYEFGLNFVRPLVDLAASKVLGKDVLLEINKALGHNENVILFANHQTEVDPQIISLLLEREFPRIAEEMIFVAGHRVITDPLAIPFSMGRNLLCIYSKKYIDAPPELKAEKVRHNQRTLKVMADLLREGGKCIYIAPSGGRDRMNAQGIVEVAPFDPQSIEMLYLIAKQAKTKTHFHTLALSTYRNMPPPKTIQQEIGELRDVAFEAAHLCFGRECPMEKPMSDQQLQDRPSDRREGRREEQGQRAQAIWQQVVGDYALLTNQK